MADYPGAIYSPRTKANRSGVVYDSTKSTVIFAEDLQKADAEIVALETFLRIPTSIPASPVAGSAYFTVGDFILHIYTGAVWKTVELG